MRRILLLIPVVLIVIWPAFAFGQDPADTLHLKEVEVFGSLRTIYPVQSIKAQNLREDAVRDIGDFLRREPNISGIRKGGVGIDPVVRGFKYSQVSVVMNGGMKIEGGCPNRMDPVTAHVESENISRIEVVRGPWLLKYGPVLGAMINLETEMPAPPDEPGLHGEALYGFETNWNGQREHLALSGGNRSVYFTASGGYKGYGSYRAGNEVLYNSSFRKAYGNGALGVALYPGHTVALSYAYNEGRDVLYPALPMDERLDRTQVAALRYRGQDLGGGWKTLEFQASASFVHHVMDNLGRPASKLMKAVTTVDARNISGKLTGNLAAGDHRIQAGIDFENVWKDGDKEMSMTMIMEGDTFVSVKHANVWLDAATTNAGVFAEYRVPSGSFDIVAALRADLNLATSGDTFKLISNGVSYFDDPDSHFFNVSFSAGFEKKLLPGLTLRVSLGRGTRSPSVLERFIKLMPVQYDAYDYLGNPQLKPESNNQADVGITWESAAAGTFSAGGFFSIVTHYITGKILPPSVIRPSTQGAPGVKQFTNVDWVRLGGFEAAYRSPAGRRWGVDASVAGTWGTNPEAVKYIVSGGQVTGQQTVKNDPLGEIPPLEGAVVFSYRFFRSKLVPQIGVRMVSAQRRVSEAYEEPETPGFVTATASVRYAPCRYFTLSAGVDNMLDTPYYEHLNRRMVGTTQRLYEPGRVFYVTGVIRW